MKRLPAAPLTEEDRQANFAFVSRCRLSLFAAKLLLDSATADRDDSELMRWAQCEGRWIRTEYGVSHYAGALGLWHLDLGGVLA